MVWCIDVLWSSSFRWSLFSRISGREKMFHRLATRSRTGCANKSMENDFNSECAWRTRTTHCLDTIIAVTSIGFSSYMPVDSREDLSLDTENLSALKMVALQYMSCNNQLRCKNLTSNQWPDYVLILNIIRLFERIAQGAAKIYCENTSVKSRDYSTVLIRNEVDRAFRLQGKLGEKRKTAMYDNSDDEKRRKRQE